MRPRTSHVRAAFLSSVAMVASGGLWGCQGDEGGADSAASGGDSAGSTGGQATGGNGFGGSGPTGGSGTGGAPDGIDWGGCTYDPGLQANILVLLESQGATSVLELKELYTNWEPYGSLAGIECLENLELLSLSYPVEEEDRPLLDLSLLADLDHLSDLFAANARLSHVEALTEIPLRSLRLGWVEMDSLEPLSGVTGLEYLELAGLGLGDLTPLSSLSGLRELRLDTLPVTTLAPLSGLPVLRNLVLWDLDIVDLEGLTHLPELADLQVLTMDIESFEGILDVPKLASIRIEGCEVVETLDGLEACEGLESIFVTRLLPDQANLMSDLGALSDMPTLKFLELAGASVSDIAPLAGCPNLERLDLKDNQVADLAPLAGLPLELLDISGNQVEAIDALAEMPLASLHISGNPIGSLEPLGTLVRLEELAMDDVGATSLDMLAGAPLIHLYAADNALSDIDLTQDWDLVDLVVPNNDIVSLPDGFVGGQGFCSRTDLRGNPLDQAAQDTLSALCEEPDARSGYVWDGGSCPATCNAP